MDWQKVLGFVGQFLFLFMALIILVLTNLSKKIYKIRGLSEMMDGGGNMNLHQIPFLYNVQNNDTTESKLLIKKRNLWVILFYVLVFFLIITSWMATK